MSASAVASAVAAGAVSATQLVSKALRRIESQDAKLGATVLTCADQALREAAELDEKLSQGIAVGPLAGVPLLVKDLENVAGLPTRYGSLTFGEAGPALADDVSVARLRRAGAIVVGKSNLSEFGTEGFSANLVQPPTRNPWNLEMSPGGSSGGSGAALAAGLVPLATATDGGGSIRIPAALCGLVGLKPSYGAVGRDAAPDWIDLSTCGPLTTTAADAALVLSVLAAPTPGDAEYSSLLPLSQLRPPSHIVATHRLVGTDPLPGSVEASFQHAVSAMAELLSLDVQWVDPGSVFAGAQPVTDWRSLATVEHVSSLGRAFVEENLGRMHLCAREFLTFGLSVAVDDYVGARRRRFSHVAVLDELVENALLLTPTIASEGWFADGRITADAEPGLLPADVIATNIQNLTGHPALSVPAGLSANGVPFGLQVTAPRGHDWLLLDLARRWQAAYPWAETAPGFEPFD